jgi:outer membrane lipoprotein-sorting protein
MSGMSFLSRYPRVRWAAPVLAGALMIGGVAVAQSSAGGQSDLAPRSAHELLVSLQDATPTPLSGAVVQTMDLGLPDLSSAGRTGGGGSGASGGLNPVTLLSGSHTWRVWYADPTHSRLALVDGSSEYDVVRNGSDLWQWSSQDQSVVHATIPDESSASPRPTRPAPSGLPDLSDPAAVATWALSQLDPTTQVTTTRTDMVAGRPAYGLVLTPRSPDTRIGSVHLSLDATTSLPLAATVLPRGSTVPAVDVRFTSVTLAAPESSVFDFTPPPGATVTTPGDPSAGEGSGAADPAAQRPTVTGTGWTSVVVGTLPQPSSSDTAATADPLTVLSTLLPRVSGTWGSGNLMTTRLFTVVLTDDGRFAAGAVDPPALYAALER